MTKLQYQERPHVCSPVNAMSGLYMLVLASEPCDGRKLLAFVRKDVQAAGYNPDGNGTCGPGTVHGVIARTYAMWFYEKAQPENLAQLLGEAYDDAERHSKSQCQDCGKVFTDDQLEEITHGIWERVSPGEPMPSGECPECGALCQPYREPIRSNGRHSPGALRAGKNISDRFRRALPHLPATNAATLAEIIDAETGLPELLSAAKGLENWLNSNQNDFMNRAQVEDYRAMLRAAIARVERKV